MTAIDETNGGVEQLLDRARRGDGAAFEGLVAPYRRELFAYCYRSLGSYHDAEDVLQDVLVSAWRALDRFDGGALRAWLYRIATNRCINHVRDQSRRPRAVRRPDLHSGVARADDPWWLEPVPDALVDGVGDGPEARFEARESIALSFVAGLQQLPQRQRAALVLRDVMGFPAIETAEILGTTVTSVNSALIRARQGFRPERSIHDVPLPRSPEEVAVVDAFVDALQQGDLERVLAVLGDDAQLSMPPQPIRCVGAMPVVTYLRGRRFWGPELHLLPTRANGQPAFAYYLPDLDTGVLAANGLMVLSVVGQSIDRLTRFGGADLVERFGLPATLSL